jgi:hypothetical protein
MNDETENWNNESGAGHPSENYLLGLLDGELEPRRSARVRTHLEACWACRARAEKFQTAISAFVEYHHTILRPSIARQRRASGFQSRFRQSLCSERDNLSLLTKMRGILNRVVWGVRHAFPNSGSARNAFGRNFSPRIVANSVTAGLLIASILVVYLFWATPGVSAEEFLSRAERTYANELRVDFQPIVHRRLEVVKRKSEAASYKPAPARLEIWHDEEATRRRHSVLLQHSTAADNVSPAVANELVGVLIDSGFDPPVPLSAKAFRNWRASVGPATDTVDELTGDDGTNLLRLTTRAESGTVRSSSLVVRKNDFHPVSQIFSVQTADGFEEFEVRETSFAVLDSASLKPGFFEDTVTAAGIPPANGSRSASPAPGEVADAAPGEKASATRTAPDAIADTDLEVEVVNLLHAVGADTGEQIEVSRQPNGPVVVTGIVESANRRDAILAALRSLRENPALRVNVQTVTEAAAEQQLAAARARRLGNEESTAMPPVQLEMHEVDGNSFALEDEVRARLSERGDDAIRRFAAASVNRSNQAMRYAFALKRLRAQFTPERLKEVSPEARSKWLNVVRTHASAYLRESAALREHLRPVFGDHGGSAKAASIGSDAAIWEAIDGLVAAGSAADRVVKSGFAAGGEKRGGVRLAQLWDNIGRADALARALQAIK